MRHTIVLAAGALALATSAAAIEPGNWSSTMRTVDIDLPGEMPAQVSDMIRTQMMQNARSSTSCVTQEDIDNAPEQMFDQTEGQCEYSRFEMADGVLDAEAQCATEQGTMNMTMTGSYTDTTYSMVSNVQMQSPMGAMNMTAEIEGERIGECG